MVIASDDVKNVINRIFLVGIAYKGRVPDLYGKIKTEIEQLDKSKANIYAYAVNCPESWKKEKNLLVLRVQNYMFCYNKTTNKNGEAIVVIHEVAENGKIVTELNDNSYLQKKKLYESIMKEVAVIVKRAINEIL